MDKLKLRNLTPKQREEVDQHIVDLSVQFDGRPTAMARALGEILNKSVSKHQIVQLKKQTNIQAKKREEMVKQGATPDYIIGWLKEVMDHDISDDLELYPPAVQEALIKMKKAGKSTKAIKQIELGGTELDEIKKITYHDPHSSASKLIQIMGMASARMAGTNVGTLNMIVNTEGDIYDNLEKQKSVVDSKVLEAGDNEGDS